VLALGAITLSACGDHAGEGKDCPAAMRAHSASGFCIPRYVSLKRGEVLGRKGPGMDYEALWIYRVRGLPVQVVAETTDWRRICDPDGGAVWVHRSMIDGRRTVMALGATPTTLYRKPGAGAVAGLLNARALASLDRCEGEWCKVKAAGVSGWAQAGRLWGVAEGPQCR
jgi:SH3-like domain-containing protein